MSITQKQIRKSLIEQLKAKGADIDLYRGLIDDYMFFCAQEKRMQADIKRNGYKYTAMSSQGKEYEKDNPSVKNAVIYNRQKLAILNQLELRTDGVETTSEDDFEL